MFSDFVGQDTPVGRITKEKVTDWLMKLKFGTRSDASAQDDGSSGDLPQKLLLLAASEGVIREDPSTSLALERPLPPLPQLLFADEVQRLLDAASTDSAATASSTLFCTQV